MAELIETVARQVCSGGRGLNKCIACSGPDECGDHWRNFSGEARAAIRATLEAAIERVRPTGYRSESLFPSGIWSGRVQSLDILRDMLAALDG